MLSLIYAECHTQALYTDCHYAECLYAECRYAECHYAECRGAFTLIDCPDYCQIVREMKMS
jgi:hypothetical protein